MQCWFRPSDSKQIHLLFPKLLFKNFFLVHYLFSILHAYNCGGDQHAIRHQCNHHQSYSLQEIFHGLIKTLYIIKIHQNQ